MPVNSELVGQSTKSHHHSVDARWTMAYSAGLGDHQSCYMDTGQAEPVIAHPMFVVCQEWPVILDLRSLRGSNTLTAEETGAGVHATHDLHIHRPVRAGDELDTKATILGLEKRKPGAFQTILLETTDAAGEPVSTTYQGSLVLGAGITGEDRPPAAPAWPVPAADADAVRKRTRIEVATGAAHVYTECARIWNPIHTDVAVAKRGGLPDIILHGTATLALAVSRILALEADEDPRRVRRICAFFGAMVRMPSTLDLVIRSREQQQAGDTVFFEVRNAEGKKAIRDGAMVLVS